MLQKKDLRKVKLLGEGAYGKVYLGKLRDRRFNQHEIPINVAIKDIPLNFSVIDKEDLLKKIQVFNKELELVKKFGSEYLINSYGYIISDDKLSLVIEYCAGGDLNDYFKPLAYQLNVKQKLEILLNTAKAIEVLHNLNIIHRDIKSMNILLKKFIQDESVDVIAKLADFGISQTSEEIENLFKGNANVSNIGTTQWMSPEDLDNKKPSFKSDIYALGIVMWEIFSEKIPYADDYTEDGDPLAPYQIAYLVPCESLRPRIDLLKENTPAEILEFLPTCWHDNKDQRPSIQEIISFLDNLLKKFI